MRSSLNFINHVRTNYPIVPICLYSESELLSTMPGVDEYWAQRFKHYFSLNKTQTLKMLDAGVEDALHGILLDLAYNITNKKEDEKI
jgi:hypothetical protein